MAVPTPVHAHGPAVDLQISKQGATKVEDEVAACRYAIEADADRAGGAVGTREVERKVVMQASDLPDPLPRK